MPAQRRSRRAATPATKSSSTWDKRLLDDKGLVYEYVKTDEINIDTAYQRPLRQPRIDRIVTEFNPDELTAVVVSKREDGSLWMLDGQHRLEALKRLGKQVILADIRTSLSREQEAFLFYRLNEGQTKVGAWDKFKARQAAKEVHAVRITNIVEKNGYFIGSITEGGIQAVGGLESAYNMGRLDKTLQILSTVWPNDRVARESMIIQGLAQFLLTFDSDKRFDPGRMLESLDTVSPSRILRRAKEIQIETGRSGQRGSTVGIAFRDAYNGKLARGSKPTRQLTGVPIVQWTRTQRSGNAPG